MGQFIPYYSMKMKENIALGLSVIAVLLSLYSIIIIEPFRFTNDSILGASLAVVSICTAIVIAYQITNSITIDRKIKQIVQEEYKKNTDHLEENHKSFVIGNSIASKMSIVSALASSENYESIYPIAVSGLVDCIQVNDESYISSFCTLLEAAHKHMDLSKVCACETFRKQELDALKLLAKSSESALRLLSLISQEERKQQEL